MDDLWLLEYARSKGLISDETFAEALREWARPGILLEAILREPERSDSDALRPPIIFDPEAA